MPQISRFFGIIISMFYEEHNPPHFHAAYGEYKIETQIVTEGWYYATQTTDTATVQNFVYDENGRIVQESQLEYEYDNDIQLVAPSTGFRNTYAYDSYGNQSVIITEYYDNGEWFVEYKYVNIYDADGIELNYEIYLWDSLASDWVGTYRYSTAYNEAGNFTEEAYYEWNSEISDWYLATIYEYFYNETGYLSALYYSEYDLMLTRANYSFDENNMPVELIEEYYDTNLEEWFNGSRTTYTYNADNLLAEETKYYWYIDIWENSELYTYAYDTEGNLNEKITKSWDGELWNVSLTETWVYDSKGRMLEYLGEPYDGKNEWAYDEFDNLILYADYIWFNPGKGEWMEFHVEEYAYNAENVLIMESNYSHIQGEGNKTEYTYENGFLIEEMTFGYWPGGWYQINNAIYTYDENDNLEEKLVKYWDEWGTQTWTDSGRELYYFSLYEVIQDVATDKLNSEVSIYPNPASNVLNFNNISGNAVISIYDLTGKQVLNQTNTNNQISVNSLTNGVYIIKIIDNSQIETAKFIKQ